MKSSRATSPAISAAGITIASASAGSGKTSRLTRDVTAAVDPRGAEQVPLEGLVAVTYTKKAHAELAARIRQKLVGAGAFDEAMHLPLAYLGTVHAACLRLLQEFALDAGLSPTVDVVAGDQGRLLRQALEHALPAEHRRRLDELAYLWQLRIDHKTKRVDWLTAVADIMDLARSNRIAPDALPAMAERSVEGFLALFPPRPEKDGDALDAALGQELARAHKKLAKVDDGTKKTAETKEFVRDALHRHEDGELTWADWAKLSRLEPGRAAREAVGPLKEAAARYELHPRLRVEARELTALVFGAARIGLAGYQQWKKERRVVDYVDMLDGALDLLDHPRVREELASRLRFVVVDEFQDTSPIQLALFVKLHALAKRSTWVGDRKQCIFEYAGADPMLMDAIAAWVSREGGKRDTLDNNYRSRPELVNACSELFAHALARHGFTREEVAVAASRETPKALAPLPPFGLFCMGGTKAEHDAESLAEGVRRMLANPSQTPVVDRTTGKVRDLRPGDVAVLVATNAEASAIANALHARGIRAALARAGLLGTPEGSLADSALRWLLDEDDTLAAATIDALTGFGGVEPEAWLASRLRANTERRGNSDGAGARRAAAGTAAEAEEEPAWRAPLARVRSELGVLSPTEALDEALAALDAVRLCARWPDPAQRVANLDALRALAAEYEGRCDQEHEAATIAGLLRHFDDMRTERLRRDELLASDDQHVPTDDGAVIVCTYHKSKGLEWPVVVMGSLDRKEKRHAFEVSPETDREGFDPETPLAGRWIRFWPWPFGASTSLPLREHAEGSAVGTAVAMREDKERARLLYVGFTRARDHLVLAVRASESGDAKTTWLDGLASADGDPLVELPAGAKDGAVGEVVVQRAKGKPLAVPARVWRVSPARTVVEEGQKDGAGAGVEARPWFAVPAAADIAELPAYRITPSNAAADWPELALPAIGEVVKLPAAMPLDARVAETNVLGDAVHAFFAADVEGLEEEKRLDLARRIVAGARLVGVVRPESLVEASDRLRAFIETRWPGATWRREVPVEAGIATGAGGGGAKGHRRLAGVIDLLLETAEGYVIFDHKTFPATAEAAWRKKVVEFLPQLGAYAESLRRAQGAEGKGKSVLGCWVHLPVGGGIVEARCGHEQEEACST